MNHGLDLIVTLTGALAAALLFGLLALRLGLSPIVGYLLAGVAVGPFTPGFVAHGEIARQFAELGVILLMFGVGLNLHVAELMRVRKIAIPGALLAASLAAAVGFAGTRWLGFGASSALVYGLALAATSTVVLLRVFTEQGLLEAEAGRIAVGWLLVEDLLVVLAVILLPVFLKGGGASGSAALARAVALALGKIGALVLLVLWVGQRALPSLLAFVARTKSRELFTLAVLVLALGLAVGSAKLFGASMALGAFLAGIAVGQSEFSARAASEARTLRDAFAVLFFVATGMLLDPAALLTNARLILLTLGVVWLAKPLSALLILRLYKYSLHTALAVALGLAQIGEFSFMVAGLGGELGVFPSAATQALVATSMLAITLNPFLVRLAARFSV